MVLWWLSLRDDGDKWLLTSEARHTTAVVLIPLSCSTLAETVPYVGHSEWGTRIGSLGGAQLCGFQAAPSAGFSAYEDCSGPQW